METHNKISHDTLLQMIQDVPAYKWRIGNKTKRQLSLIKDSNGIHLNFIQTRTFGVLNAFLFGYEIDFVDGNEIQFCKCDQYGEVVEVLSRICCE